MDPNGPRFAGLLRGHLRDLLAGAAMVAVISAATLALLVGRVDLGLTFAVEGDRVVIDSVAPGSPASREGFAPGMIVLSLNGFSLVQLPESSSPQIEDGLTGGGIASAAPAPTLARPPQTSAGPTAAPVSPSPAPVASGAQATPPPEASTAAPSGATATPPSGATATPSPVPATMAPAVPVPSASPSSPAYLSIDPRSLALLLSEPVRQLDATSADNLAQFPPESPKWYTYLGRDYVGELGESGYLFVAGLLLLAIASWLLATGRIGGALQPLAVPLAVAVAIPLVGQPLEATWMPVAMSFAGVMVPFGIAPLGLALADGIEDPEPRGIARMAALGAALLAMLIGIGRAWLPQAPGTFSDPGGSSLQVSWIVLAGGAALVPGLIAGFQRRGQDPRGAGGRVVQGSEVAVAGATPLVSLATGISSLPLFLPLSAWFAAIVVAARWTVRPLARVAARATLQRDLVVAATEAERARVAAEIHDDALQELTLLVRRLDEAGDTDGAEIARTVSERLRAILGDLRLPILDDLGVGPALDWLAERMQRLAGGPVNVERIGDARLPPEVELAFFRIAQEAVGNAVKHGRTPITIRYHATGGGASLAVDDAGPGIASEAADQAEQAGRFGILNMQQRAEQVGALLDIRRWPGGGTHVALEWRAT